MSLAVKHGEEKENEKCQLYASFCFDDDDDDVEYGELQ